jgi:Mg2+/Co2+ transporter CorC
MPTHTEIATIGGLLSELLGRLPLRGDAIEWGGYRFTVLSASQRGAELITISRVD